MKKIIWAIWLVLVVNNLYAEIGARAIGMGGAFVGVGGDVTGIYWNPAGLGLLKEGAFGYITSPAYRKDTFTTISLIEEPRDDYYFYILPNRVLASVLKLKEDSLPEGVIGYVYASDVFKYIDKVYKRDYINSHQLSIGLKLSEGFYWGVNIKGCSMKRYFKGVADIRDIQTGQTIGISQISYTYPEYYTDMDIGFLLKTEYISFGAVLAHVNKPSIYMPERIYIIQILQAVAEATQTVTIIEPREFIEKRLPRIFKAGVAITPDDKTIFSLDIYDISGNTKNEEEDLSQDLSIGIERKITDNLAICAGLWHINSKSKDNKGISASISYNFKLFNNNIVNISYGYVTTKKERHSLGIAVRF